MILKFEPTDKGLPDLKERNETWFIKNSKETHPWYDIPDILKFIKQQCSSSPHTTQ